MFTFGEQVAAGHPLSLFVCFFVAVWVVWLAKAVIARRHQPYTDDVPSLSTCVLMPVYNEPPNVLRDVLGSIIRNRPDELVVIVDGGDPVMVTEARPYASRVVTIPKAGKRAAIAAGLDAARPADVYVVLDSDTLWEPDTLRELLRPFADPRVGGVTPRQMIIDRHANAVRRLADWIEDLRYSAVVPAQSVLGQVGCLAGRTIAYRAEAFRPAVAALRSQSIFGVEMHVGDDRVLTNEMLRRGWRTVYQPTTTVHTDAPNTWRAFWRQQLRWGRSSQRETLLSLRWLWRRPLALSCLVADAPVKRLVQTRAPVVEIAAAAAANGMHTLKQDGIDKVIRGLTDMQQVRTV